MRSTSKLVRQLARDQPNGLYLFMTTGMGAVCGIFWIPFIFVIALAYDGLSLWASIVPPGIGAIVGLWYGVFTGEHDHGSV